MQRRAYIVVATAIGTFPSVAYAHDFSWVPWFVGIVATLQALPAVWLIYWHRTRAVLWHAFLLIASWPIAVGAVFEFNNIWPVLLLLTPWIFFAYVAIVRARDAKHAP